MIDSGRPMVAAGIALCSLLVACGQTQDETLTAGKAGGAAGASSAASLGGAGPSEGSSASAGANASGGGPVTSDPEQHAADVNVSGRWAMFGFEDPVGVALSQSEGALSGIGCGVGTPPASKASYCSADLTGTIAGGSVKFDFKSTADILPGRYLADLVASKDGKRMAGRFGIGTSVSTELWIAWLPVQGNDDFWLPVAESEPSLGSGQFELRLSSAEAGDPSFDSQATYWIAFGPYGLVGELGAFFLSEMRRVGNGVEAGPVSPTVPELPVYVSFTGPGSAYTSVTARLSNGHTFTFDVLPSSGGP
jgi:hypothetical protein